VLFVGRLSHEKGVAVLAEAMQRLNGAVPLTVVGTGPLAGLLEGLPGVTLRGALPADEVMAEMRRARLLVLPSIWYENFPRTLVEAFACGTPVVASRLGAMEALVQDGVTGAHFEAGNAVALADTLSALYTQPDRCSTLGASARQQYEEELTPDAAYRRLSSIYDGACRKEAPHG
jgi:glycosyltransferase involved in cell wall biosynthesis